jgi:hypothetical protein
MQPLADCKYSSQLGVRRDATHMGARSAPPATGWTVHSLRHPHACRQASCQFSVDERSREESMSAYGQGD